MTKTIIITDYKKATDFINLYKNIVTGWQTCNGYTIIEYKNGGIKK